MPKFINIDSFLPCRFERIGILKGKRWYFDKQNRQMALFKPRRFEYGDKKIFCANHYGEVVAYILAKESEIPVCRAELAHLSRYYSNIHKERNNGTSEEKDGCITYNVLRSDEELEHGRSIIEYFILSKRSEYERLTENDLVHYADDNLEVILFSIEERTRSFYADIPGISSDYIEIKVKSNRRDAIRMMVYDCLYGNNDRHDENWAMRRGKSDISLYPLYDNERVLGLYENENLVKNALEKETVESVSEEVLFSRMRVPGEKNKFSNYKDVLMYLIKNYREETFEVLNNSLQINTPQRVRQYLGSCERLPEEYVNFGSLMYESRYNFAKQLCNKKRLEFKER